jgi:hypothetical protein
MNEDFAASLVYFYDLESIEVSRGSAQALIVISICTATFNSGGLTLGKKQSYGVLLF